MRANEESEPPFEAYKGTGPYVFISYAHSDSKLVFPELIRLKAWGANVWYDEGIDPGNEWPDEIAGALEACSFFLFFVSPRSVASVNCRNEVYYALELGRPFLSLHLEETKIGAINKGLALSIGALQAVLKYRMNESSYERKMKGSLAKVLPLTIPCPPAEGERIADIRQGRPPFATTDLDDLPPVPVFDEPEVHLPPLPKIDLPPVPFIEAAILPPPPLPVIEELPPLPDQPSLPAEPAQPPPPLPKTASLPPVPVFEVPHVPPPLPKIEPNPMPPLPVFQPPYPPAPLAPTVSVTHQCWAVRELPTASHPPVLPKVSPIPVAASPLPVLPVVPVAQTPPPLPLVPAEKPAPPSLPAPEESAHLPPPLLPKIAPAPSADVESQMPTMLPVVVNPEPPPPPA